MIVFTQRKFYDEFTGIGGGGTTYPNHRVLGKCQAITEFYFQWGVYEKRLIFDAATKTISRDNYIDFYSFITEGELRVGDIITIVNTASNNGNKTIASITDDEITTVEALVNETAESADINGVTPVTAADFYYNLITNEKAQNLVRGLVGNAQVRLSNSDYLSAVDNTSRNKFSASGLDASSATPITMEAQGNSIGWLTDETITIEGVSIANYRQSFKIKHTYYQSPFWLQGQTTNFNEISAPDYYFDTESLTYICKVDGKYSYENPTIPHSNNLVDTEGATGWFNESNTQREAPYEKVSITYKDVDDNVLDRLDINIVNYVTIVIKSNVDTFEDDSYVVLQHIRCPQSETEYVNTETDMRQNFLYDRKYLKVDTGGNGEFYGTDYQALTNISVTRDDQEITIEFRVDYSAYIKTLLKSKSSTDRYYAFAVETQDPDTLTTANRDAVNILVDFQNADYNQDDDTLTQLVDYIRCYEFPNRGTEPKNNVAGYVGDPIYVDVPFRVKKDDNITLISAGVQIVAIKEGEEDFILEEKTFNVAQYRKLNQKQTVDIVEKRDFKTYTGDLYNEMSLVQNPAFDDVGYTGYFMRYGFILGYETWRSPIDLSQANKYDVAKNIDNLSENWSRYTHFGWAVVYRWFANTQAEDGHITYDFAETDILIKDSGEVTAQAFELVSKEFFDEDDESVESVIIGGVTKFIYTFEGSLAIPSGFTAITGFIFADIEDIGGRNFRRFANPEFASESDSPFSPAATQGGDITFANGNLRIDIFTTETKIVLSGYFDDTVQNWGERIRPKSILLYPRVIYKGETSNCALLDEETGNPLLSEEGFALLNEDC